MFINFALVGNEKDSADKCLVNRVMKSQFDISVNGEDPHNIEKYQVNYNKKPNQMVIVMTGDCSHYFKILQ